MALPPDDNEPEPLEEEEEIIEAGFDPLLFWDQYRTAILVVGGIILLGLIGFGVYEFRQTQYIAAASQALAQADSEDAYRQVIASYPGTIAAGNASIFLSGTLSAEKKYDDALQVLQDFLDKYPTHPLASAGDLSYAEILEAQGKTDEAVARYEEVSAKYPESFSAPLAAIAEANILQAQAKIEEARRLYENFIAQFPDSIFSQEAMAQMHLLPPSPNASPTPGTQSNPEGLPDLTNALPAASASAAPSVAVPRVPAASPH